MQLFINRVSVNELFSGRQVQLSGQLRWKAVRPVLAGVLRIPRLFVYVALLFIIQYFFKYTYKRACCKLSSQLSPRTSQRTFLGAEKKVNRLKVQRHFTLYTDCDFTLYVTTIKLFIISQLATAMRLVQWVIRATTTDNATADQTSTATSVTAARNSFTTTQRAKSAIVIREESSLPSLVTKVLRLI